MIVCGLFSNHKYLHRTRRFSITKNFRFGRKSCQVYFPTFDLKSAYHQIRQYTAFEANGQHFQFTCLPFGVTNSVHAFRRAMNEIVKEENLTDTFPYLDNVIIGGETEEEHDNNVENFMRVVRKRHLTLNNSKTIKKVP